VKPRRFKSRKGAALVEAALLMPILLLLILNMANLGIYIFAWITVNNAARAAAEYSAYNGTAVNLPAQPTFAQIQALTNNDVSSLPNYAASTNPTLQVCSNTNGTLSCSGSCTGVCSTPADPEPSIYTVNYVDVEYSFTPVFSAFSLPSLGISLTIPPSLIHRQAVMRRMQ
jgi:Flp pilus assembly protein TadG